MFRVLSVIFLEHVPSAFNAATEKAFGSDVLCQ